MILALNTAQNTHELALLSDGKILFEQRWPDSRDDIEKLPKLIDQALAEAKLSKQDLSDLVVITGPGPFTGIRSGVAFMNALAKALEKPLHTLDTFTLLKLKAQEENPLVILNAGGLDIALNHNHEVKVGPMKDLLAPLPHQNLKLIFEGKESQATQLHGIALEKGWTQVPETLTLAQVIQTHGLTPFSQEEDAQPYYLKRPVITKSKDPWKQA